MNITRRNVLRGGAVLGGTAVVGSAALRAGRAEATVDVSRSADWGDQEPPESYDDYDRRTDEHVVAADGTGEFETIQAAVDAAEPRDLILVEPGVYHGDRADPRAAVDIRETPQLTIRGTDRSEVVLDGRFEVSNGILARTDGVVVENLTVRNVVGNGVYWLSDDIDEPIHGYRASYVTAHNIGVYAIYARNAEYGRFEHCYASGCEDAGYYIGESQPAHAVIDDCIAEYNAMGYSGTNAGGDLVIRNSIWRHNMTGIVPNTLDSQAGAPQGHSHGGIRIENNHVHDNNRLDVPAISNAYAVYGTGIAVAGGQNNDIYRNTIENQAKYGIVIFPMITDTDIGTLPLRILRGYLPVVSDDRFYPPSDNVVANNEVTGSGRTDLALGAPATGNRFVGNDVGSVRPALLERRDGSFGDVMVFLQVLRDFAQTEFDYPSGRTEDQPAPDPDAVRADLDEYELADPEAPPRPPIGGLEYE